MAIIKPEESDFFFAILNSHNWDDYFLYGKRQIIKATIGAIVIYPIKKAITAKPKCHIPINSGNKLNPYPAQANAVRLRK